MADHTPVNLPDEIEALLRESMAVEPTPQFAARVRQRIELEPQKTRWNWTWLIAAGAACAALVLAIVLPLSRSHGNESLAVPAAGPAPAVEIARVPRQESPSAAGNSERARVETSRAPIERLQPGIKVRPERSEFPTVIVDPRQRAALNALARLGAQGTVSEEVLEKLAATPASVPASIAVDPLVVSPIAVGGVLHYEIERY
jgi:hypothetical protein